MFRRWADRLLLSRVQMLRIWLCLCLPLLLVLLVGCETGVYHTVKPGQTLYRISKTYDVSEASLVRANRINDPTKVRAGTRLFVPGADRVRSVTVVKPAQKATPVTKTIAAKVSSKKTTTAKKVVVKKPSAKISQPARSTDVKKLEWPLRGKIVRSFSSQAEAGRGKGIEIAVRSGTTVVAAEAGKVIYSGDGVNGYGHLIILQHENDLFTVYGFNQRNYVKQGDFVSKGEKVALSGTPPAGGSPRLHFEVRKGKQAVNPILYLP
ncbi:lipoprotein NlpD [Malonomonas rubra DSM 5091]|uniref:Lipoprotein NlpD n=1 Tax=Malonomonas rubra DSM 5091 TaxID=1122189 RepID=A0A1M6DC44_MALRU|nr:M23 family metallopeptidase [Malonomonas rubra]SHI70641.1 lipoprotein NlpD [Malonomonas rubra DSM 5091]